MLRRACLKASEGYSHQYTYLVGNALEELVGVDCDFLLPALLCLLPSRPSCCCAIEDAFGVRFWLAWFQGLLLDALAVDECATGGDGEEEDAHCEGLWRGGYAIGDGCQYILYMKGRSAEVEVLDAICGNLAARWPMTFRKPPRWVLRVRTSTLSMFDATTTSRLIVHNELHR